MYGSPYVAALVAQVAFAFLLVYGYAWRELSLRHVAFFVLVWLVARFGFPRVPFEWAAAMFPPFVAVLDIVLVLMIFKGDVSLT
jgi:hypothetical protein